MSTHDSDVDSMLFSASDEESVSFDDRFCTPEEVNDDFLTDDRHSLDSNYEHRQPLSEEGILQSPSSPVEVPAIVNPPQVQADSANAPSQDLPQSSSKKRKFPRLGENLDGSVRPRLIIKQCRKQVFLRRLKATKDLDENFYIPNRAKLILDFLRSHGDRMVKEKNGPKQSFPSTLSLVQHVMSRHRR